MADRSRSASCDASTRNDGPAPSLETVRARGGVGRWFEILDAFVWRDEWGARKLAAELGLPKTSVHRILREMSSTGVLAFDTRTQTFRIGPVLTRLSVLLSDRIDVTKVAHPILESTAAQTGETVMFGLYAPSRRQFSVVDAAESTHPVRLVLAAYRDWAELHVGSSGKGILAFLPQDEQDQIIRDLPEPSRSHGSVSHDALRTQLAVGRRRGYVLSRGERIEGTVGVAAPVRDANGRVVGDVIISWPASRSSPSREKSFGGIVIDAAAAISRGLGYSPSALSQIPGSAIDVPSRGESSNIGHYRVDDLS